MNITTDNVTDLESHNIQASRNANTTNFVVNLLQKKTPTGTKVSLGGVSNGSM